MGRPGDRGDRVHRRLDDRQLTRPTRVKIAVLKERASGETRVAATPETVKKFAALGALCFGGLIVYAAAVIALKGATLAELKDQFRRERAQTTKPTGV